MKDSGKSKKGIKIFMWIVLSVPVLLLLLGTVFVINESNKLKKTYSVPRKK